MIQWINLNQLKKEKEIIIIIKRIQYLVMHLMKKLNKKIRGHVRNQIKIKKEMKMMIIFQTMKKIQIIFKIIQIKVLVRRKLEILYNKHQPKVMKKKIKEQQCVAIY